MQGPQIVRRPLVGAGFGFTLGVAAAPSTSVAADLFVLVVILAGLIHFARQRRVLASLLLPLPFFFAGLVAGTARLPPPETITARAGALADEGVIVEGLVAEAVARGADKDRLLLDVVGTSTVVTGDVFAAQGRVALWFRDGGACGRPGDRIRVWAKLRAPTEALMPGRMGPRAVAARRGIALYGSVKDGTRCTVVAPAGDLGLRTLIEHTRDAIHRRIDATLSPRRAGIVRALTTGDRSGIDDDLNEAFRISGLTHLLAISGLHLAVAIGGLLLLIELIARRIPWLTVRVGARRFAAMAVLPVVPLYAALVGAAASASRAAVMIGCLLLAQIARRTPDPWSALGLALLILLSWDPAGLGDIGFQLSFAAVAALLRIYPALVDAVGSGRWPNWLRWPTGVVLASTAATIGTMPLVARHFSRVSLIGLIAGLPAIPLASLVLVPLALTGSLLALSVPAIGGPVIELAGFAAEVLASIAEGAAAVPFAAVRVPTPTILECVLFYCGSIALCLRPPSRRARRFAVVSFASLALVFGGLQLVRVADGGFEVAFLPVGQGDATVLELPHGRVAVIDTGPEGAVDRVVAPYLHLRRYTKVDLLVVTHPHADHDGGVAELLAHFPVDRIWWSGDPNTAPELRRLYERHGATVVTAESPSITIGGVELAPLGPTTMAVPRTNDRSVVVSATFGQRRFLFTGDAEAAAEAAMLAAASDRGASERGAASELRADGAAAALHADVLKVGHHGSDTSSTEAFVSAVAPKHAVISVGHRNRFGLPDELVQDRLHQAGAAVWRTDRHGLVIIRTDGSSLEVEPFRAE